MTEPVPYHPATLRVDPDTLPAIRNAIDLTLLELTPHIPKMREEAHIAEPWLEDSAGYETWKLYE